MICDEFENRGWVALIACQAHWDIMHEEIFVCLFHCNWGLSSLAILSLQRERTFTEASSEASVLCSDVIAGLLYSRNNLVLLVLYS